MTWSFWLPLFGFVVAAGAALGVAVLEYYTRTEDLHRTGVLMWGGLSAIYCACAAWVLFGPEDVRGVAFIPGAASAYCAYRAWLFWRNRKDRKPSRVLGVVRNLGHRLAVVPVPGGSP